MHLSKPIAIAAMVIAVCGIACKNSTGPASPSSTNRCGELAGSTYVPTSLHTPLCIAHDSAGAFYVVDSCGWDYRCFISRHDSLIRKNVVGSSTISEKYYFLSLEDTTQIIFQSSANTWSDAYVIKHGKCDKCDSILFSKIDMARKDPSQIDEGWKLVVSYLQNELPGAVALGIGTAADIQNYKVVNFQPKTHIEYLAQQPEGQYILVTRPEYDWDGNVALHYGAKDNMEKCTVTSFLRASDGGSTWIKFDANGKKYEAVFTAQMDSVGIHYSQTYLKIDSDSVGLQLLSPTYENCALLGFNCPSLR